MNYLTRHMVALRDMRHDGYELKEGDTFNATPVDALYLTTRGKAKEVDAPGNLPSMLDIGQVTTLPPSTTTSIAADPIEITEPPADIGDAATSNDGASESDPISIATESHVAEAQSAQDTAETSHESESVPEGAEQESPATPARGRGRTRRTGA